MSCYLTSTQKRFWILTREDIEKRRSDARRRAIESAQEARASTGEPLQTDGPEPLTDEEETLLRRYYEAKILKVCAAFSLPSKVQATAVTLSGWTPESRPEEASRLAVPLAYATMRRRGS